MRNIKSAIWLFASLLGAAAVFAADGVWTKSAASKIASNYRDTSSGSPYNWTDAVNWDGGVVPITSADTATLSNTPDVATDIAGMGTPIASLASLITIKSFLNYRRDDAGLFMKLFLSVGFGFPIVLCIVAALFL